MHNAFTFAAFNALSFQLVLGSPMVLYGKSLGASATVLGIISGMVHLLTIFQVPAANHIARIGYKRFVYAGWGIRVMFIGVMSAVPLFSGLLAPSTLLSLMLMLLFCFNLSRGISSAAWLPWITSLLPNELRGRFLAREAAFVNSSSFCAFVLAALCLSTHADPWRFGVVFAFSTIMGAISLSFLKRIPDVDPPEPPKPGSGPVPWLAMAAHPPFRKLLHVVLAWSIGYGGINTFTVALLKSEALMSERTILLIMATAYLGGWASLWILGSGLDRLGSKPVLLFCFAIWLVILVGMTLIAGRVLQPSISILVPLQVLMGLTAALAQMANTRLAMVTIPVMGRSHFFALFTVVGSLVLGLSPILWGIFIDLLKPLKIVWYGFEWNRFSVFFFLLFFVFIVAIELARRLDEPKAGSLEDLFREVMQQSPLRLGLRLWPKS